ncbi:hypothetical protein [Pseudomonas syringae]|uniref:hypothetical protein n=1 Tax=Pseudomonas syringae TaxID=317 RepID=UPI001F396F61|nr:hypothetical protein [Pseudomonas syringae]MCF5374492.1 hypothetical protein [Pseudomonas syringae]MCF5381977.1 hypothetical protein [Pseudomonas syringae]MCF5419491.1 hypothetical protein [Pseudomonas syringae]MCF5454835.1 hypothetical protein [Pseudomonas syringae]MCF5456323.1 hypothetical protein [Pseudomonas syringae]
MDQLSAGILSVVITALATYFGGNLFFDSSLPIADALKTALLTMHVRFMFFMMFGVAIYSALRRGTAWMSRSRHNHQ